MIAPHLKSSIDAARKRLALIDRIFPPVDHRDPPILPRDLSGVSEPQTPSCGRYGLGCLPDHTGLCFYCGDISEEGA